MIDLKDFTKLETRPSYRDCYIRRLDGKVKLYLDRDTTDAAKRYFGPDVTVYIEPELGMVVLVRGNDRRISSMGSGDRNTSQVALGNSSAWEAAHGDFTRLFCDHQWEQTKDGSKALLFSFNGRKDMEQPVSFGRR